MLMNHATDDGFSRAVLVEDSDVAELPVDLIGKFSGQLFAADDQVAYTGSVQVQPL